MDQTSPLSAVGECYLCRGVAADQLPYTEEFERLWEDVQKNRAGAVPTRAAFWRLLANARKRGRLPRLAR